MNEMTLDQVLDEVTGYATGVRVCPMRSDLKSWMAAIRSAKDELTELRAYAATLRQQAERSGGVVSDDWRETFVELLEDYAGARAETATWNVTQRVQPEGGIRMPRPRLAKLMAHVDQLAAPLLCIPPAEQGGMVDDLDAAAHRLGGYLAREQSVFLSHKSLRAPLTAALAQNAQGEVEAVALPMSSAPRDGTIVRLLVKFTDHNLDDTLDPVWTIGQNGFDHNGEDEWQFAGWCWTHDHFTSGEGTPIGWLPLHAERARVPTSCDGKEQEAFETWAKSQNHDMSCHPLHWLFLNKETYAARQGWRGALDYVNAQLAAASSQDAEPRAHQWDRDGERCVVCGDKDWMGGPCNGPLAAAPSQPAQDAPHCSAHAGFEYDCLDCSDALKAQRRPTTQPAQDAGEVHS